MIRCTFTLGAYAGTGAPVIVTPTNTAPSINNQTLTATAGSDLIITLGPLTDSDGDAIVYTVSGSADYSPGAAANLIVFNAASAGSQTLTVLADDGVNTPVSSTINIAVNAADALTPVYGDTITIGGIEVI